MNYYKRHLGDYAKDTRHLSMSEHGAYCLLLDYYYSTEKPIPDDRCERIANAYADFEREAVRAVLGEFFVKTEAGWVSRKADEVIAEASVKSLKAKESAEARWNKHESERNANASKTHSKGNASHKPLAIKEQKATPDGELFDGIPEQVVHDFKQLRQKLRAPITTTAMAGIRREAGKAGLTLTAALTMCCERGWRGFKAEWVTGDSAATTTPRPPEKPEFVG